MMTAASSPAMPEAAALNAQAPGAAGETLTLLVFRLAEQAFAVPVLQVNEILDPVARTPVPNAPPELPALVNVRGTVAPLLDIRRRIGLGASGNGLGEALTYGEHHAGPDGAETGAAAVGSTQDTETTEETLNKRFVVLEMAWEGTRQRLAVEVDAVETVIDVSPRGMQSVPALGAAWPAELIRGAVRHEGRLIVVMEPQALCETAAMAERRSEGPGAQ